jgi:TonB dependent receptor-like, beta-barrel
MDANISSKQTFYGRYTYYHQKLLGYDPFGTGGYTTGNYGVPQYWKNQQAVLNDTYVFSPTTLLNVNFSWLRQFVDQEPKSSGFDLTQLGWPNSLVSQIHSPTLPTISVTGLTSFAGETGTIIHIAGSDFDLAASLTKIVGRHSIKFGGEYRPQLLNYLQQNSGGGTFSYSPSFTSSDPLHPVGGVAFASFMLGYGSGGLSIANAVAQKETYKALYIQDDYRMTSKLTWNVGLRYSLDPSFTERFNRESIFLPNATSPLAQPTGLPLKGVLGVVASPEHPSRNNFNLNKLEFAPRIGLAYRLAKNTVIRTGYGIFWLPARGTLDSIAAFDSINAYSNPFVGTVDGGLTPYNTLGNPFPTGLLQPPGRGPALAQTFYGSGFVTSLPGSPHPYAQQWNFNIQQELPHNWLVDIAYAGAKGTHLPIGGLQAPLDALNPTYLSLGSQLLNKVANPFYGLITTGSLATPTTTEGQLLRPYPQYTAVNIGNFGGGDSHYNSMQLKIEKRFRGGGNLLIVDTISKLISNTDSANAWLEAVGGYGLPQNWYNLSAEQSLAAFDVAQRFVASYVLDLPVGKGKKWLSNPGTVMNKLVSGWGVDGIVTLQSGFPLRLSTAQNLTNSFGGSSRPNSNGQNASLSGSAESRLNKWFNTADFSQPAAFTFGNASRTEPNLRADGIGNWDAALFKKTQFGPDGKLGLEYRVEVFNFMNHPQFSYPGMVFGTAQFGVVSGQANDPRLIQMALRFTF